MGIKKRRTVEWRDPSILPHSKAFLPIEGLGLTGLIVSHQRFLIERLTIAFARLDAN